ncbi:hypothetical protein ACA910_020140 [Epithemia clementina (nom. ined.)]
MMSSMEMGKDDHDVVKSPNDSRRQNAGEWRQALSSTESDTDGSHQSVDLIPPSSSYTSNEERGTQSSILSPKAVVARYVFLTFAAALLTALCPETRIYRVNHVDREEHQQQDYDKYPTLEAWVELVLVYAMVMVTFFVVFQSDPGIITNHMMKEWNDGASLDGNNNSHGETEESDGDPTNHSGPNFSRGSSPTAATITAGSPQKRHTIHNSNSTRFLHDNTTSDEDHGEEDSSHELYPLTTSTTKTPSSTTNLGTPTARTRRPFCEKCGFAPPLRSHHCKVCDRHVAMFDHHCDFIGTCIGERNHCRFWWFLTAQAVGFWYLVHTIGSSPHGFVSLLFHSTNHHYNHGNSHDAVEDTNALFYQALRVVAAKLYVYPLALIAWLVWAIHTFLAATNSTTFEWSKGARHLEYLRGTQATDLPYSFRSLDQNISFFCCQRDAFCDASERSAWGMFCCCFSRNNSFPVSSSSLLSNALWRPTVWYPPGKVVRDSEDWWEHPWQNKYWSCC